MENIINFGLRPTKQIKDFVKEKEGFKPNAYLCPAGVWTIGYGSTYYEDGKVVKKGDQITRQRAEALFETVFENFALKAKQTIATELNANQFSALVSLTYNIGIPALKTSTLLKKVNKNPKDTDIRVEFLKWNKATVNGKLVVLNGLTTRRKQEAEIYFTPIEKQINGK
jgi:lysozyme